MTLPAFLNEFFTLLWGTVIYRPYVYAFFACFIFFATYHMGWKRMLTFLISTFLVAFACEYSSTRNGFPFGPYTYIDTTRDRELWISNVPSWDSLSFVFLSYFSMVLAAGILKADLKTRAVPWLGGLLMMLLDVVIDPLTLQGEKWFLGKIYTYPHEGFYFGVTAANFAGWFFVGLLSQWIFQWFLKILPWCKMSWRKVHPWFFTGIFLVYSGVFIFNLVLTVAIGDYILAFASGAVTLATLLFSAKFLFFRKWVGDEYGLGTQRRKSLDLYGNHC